MEFVRNIYIYICIRVLSKIIFYVLQDGSTAEARALEYDCPPTPKPEESPSQYRRLQKVGMRLWDDLGWVHRLSLV